MVLMGGDWVSMQKKSTTKMVVEILCELYIAQGISIGFLICNMALQDYYFFIPIFIPFVLHSLRQLDWWKFLRNSRTDVHKVWNSTHCYALLLFPPFSLYTNTHNLLVLAHSSHIQVICQIFQLLESTKSYNIFFNAMQTKITLYIILLRIC